MLLSLAVHHMNVDVWVAPSTRPDLPEALCNGTLRYRGAVRSCTAERDRNTDSSTAKRQEGLRPATRALYPIFVGVRRELLKSLMFSGAAGKRTDLVALALSKSPRHTTHLLIKTERRSIVSYTDIENWTKQLAG